MTISALPTPPSRSDSPDTFATQADALLGALPQLVTEINAESDAINARIEQVGNIDQQAVMWVSGTTYALGVAVWSPLTLQTYRRKVAGAGATDPSIDDTNWQPIGASLAQLHAAALSF